MGYLVTRPDFETVTRIGAAFFKRYIVDPAREKGLLVHDLYGEGAQGGVFWACIQSPDVTIVTGCGHGDPDTFTGQQYAVLIARGSYSPELIKDKWISHLSCSTGKRLGPDLVKNGAAGFKGYRDTYIFYADAGAEDPTEDPYAKSFMGPDVVRHAWPIEGSDPEAADSLAREQYQNWAVHWSTRDPEISAVILYDLSIMVLYRKGEDVPRYCWLPKWIRNLIGCGY